MNRTGPLQHTECCGIECVWLRGAVVDNGKPRPAWVRVECASVKSDSAEDFAKDRRGFPIVPEGAQIHVCEKEEAGAQG